MKKLLIALALYFLFSSNAFAADLKISEMTEATSVANTDILPVVINPASTPANRKATLATIFNGNYTPTGTWDWTSATVTWPSSLTITSLTLTGASSLALGTAGANIGSATFYNATSGSVLLRPVNGALGTQTIYLPAETGTICTTGSVCTGYASSGAQTFTGSLNLDDGTGASPSLIFTDGTDETAALSKVDSGYLSLTTLAADGLNIVTGNLKVGDGSPGQTLNGEDAYVEGLLEVDGVIYADGGVVGNASTATALAADPADCGANELATGIAASGALTCTSSISVSSIALPAAAGPTVDAAGEIAVDTTSDQLAYYGGAKRVLPYKKFLSFVIAAPAVADDINLLKAPYGMTILAINCIVQGTTSVTGQIQECSATGGDCADLDSDIVCDADGAADDGSLTDSTIASGGWLRWKTTSVSDAPTFLTVTVTYSVVSD